jgi:hypothetical protein
MFKWCTGFTKGNCMNSKYPNLDNNMDNLESCINKNCSGNNECVSQSADLMDAFCNPNFNPKSCYSSFC